MKDAGVELIVTVDNGITAIREAELIQSLGMRLLVTDHHQPLSELPEAEAVVDPHRLDETAAFRNLCGAGAVLKLIIAMEGGDDTIAMEQYGDLAAIATVADVVELAGENRWIVQQGLRLLANTERPGLLALMEKSGILGKPFSSTTIAFSLAPRINASGRFGSPLTAVKLLLCEDPEEAAELAEELDRRNQARKEEEAEILQQIAAQVQEHPNLLRSKVPWYSPAKTGTTASSVSLPLGHRSDSRRPFWSPLKKEPPVVPCVHSERFPHSAAYRHVNRYSCGTADIPAPADFRCLQIRWKLFRKWYSLTPGRVFRQCRSLRWKLDKNCLPEELTLENIASLSGLSAIRRGKQRAGLPSATLCSSSFCRFPTAFTPNSVSRMAPWQWTCCCSGQDRRRCSFSRAMPATS